MSIDSHSVSKHSDTTHEDRKIAAAIRRIVQDKEKRDAVGQAAAETIPVAWIAIMERVLARYATLIEKRSVKRN